MESIALSALRSRYASVYARVKLPHELWDLEGCDGFAKLLIRAYGTSPAFFGRLGRQHEANECCHSFLEHYITSRTKEVSDRQLAEILGTELGRIIFGLIDRGSIAPPGKDVFKIDQEYRVIVRALAQSGAIQRHAHPSTLINDLCRISNDTDRVHILETIIPTVEFLTEESAETICGTFSNIEMGALARWIVGTWVDEERREKFLSIAIRGFSMAKSSTLALRALSKYAGNYADPRLRGMIRSSIALAGGIGDSGELKMAYVRASIGIPDEMRFNCLKGDFWYFPDTMPTQPPSDHLPRGSSLVCLPFWHRLRLETAAKRLSSTIESTASAAKFLDFTISHLSKLSTDTTRADTYEKLADIAQEFFMRDMNGYARVLADAMFDTAIMYR